MKKSSAFLTSVLAALLFVSCGQQSLAPEDLAVKVDKSQQARILITTDLEADDMNGVVLSLMYADHYDLAGIVWTAGMFHFSGDANLKLLNQLNLEGICYEQHKNYRYSDLPDDNYVVVEYFRAECSRPEAAGKNPKAI